MFTIIYLTYLLNLISIIISSLDQKPIGAELRKNNSILNAAILVASQFARARDQVIHEQKVHANTVDTGPSRGFRPH